MCHSFVSSKTRAVLLALLTVGSIGVLPMARAVADCTTEQSIFVAPETDTANGSLNVIAMHDRDLNSNCSSQPAIAWSTAHVTNTGAVYKQAEVGYDEYLAGSTHIFKVFWETQIGHPIFGGFNSGPPLSCCPDVAFKVVSVPNTNNWKFYYSINNTGNYLQTGPTNGAGADFNQGNPHGETSRFGGDNTGASDYQFELQKKQGETGSFTFWGSNAPALMNDGNLVIDNWHWQRLNDHAYEIVKDP